MDGDFTSLKDTAVGDKVLVLECLDTILELNIFGLEIESLGNKVLEVSNKVGVLNMECLSMTTRWVFNKNVHFRFYI